MKNITAKPNLSHKLIALLSEAIEAMKTTQEYSTLIIELPAGSEAFDLNKFKSLLSVHNLTGGKSFQKVYDLGELICASGHDSIMCKEDGYELFESEQYLPNLVFIDWQCTVKEIKQAVADNAEGYLSSSRVMRYTKWIGNDISSFNISAN